MEPCSEIFFYACSNKDIRIEIFGHSSDTVSSLSASNKPDVILDEIG